MLANCLIFSTARYLCRLSRREPYRGTSYFPTLTLPPPSSPRGLSSIGWLCSLSSGRPELDHLSLRECRREHGFRGTGRLRERGGSKWVPLSVGTLTRATTLYRQHGEDILAAFPSSPCAPHCFHSQRSPGIAFVIHSSLRL